MSSYAYAVLVLIVFCVWLRAPLCWAIACYSPGVPIVFNVWPACFCALCCRVHVCTCVCVFLLDHRWFMAIICVVVCSVLCVCVQVGRLCVPLCRACSWHSAVLVRIARTNFVHPLALWLEHFPRSAAAIIPRRQTCHGTFRETKTRSR